MRPISAVLVFSITLSGPGAAHPGQETKPPHTETRQVASLPLTVRESIHMALNHNLDIEISRYQPWIEDQNILAAMGPFDFVAYANGNHDRSLTPQTSFFTGANTLDQRDTKVAAGVRTLLPVGATLDASLSSDRFETNSIFSLLNPQYQQTLALNFTLPILKGAGVTSNTSTLIIARYSKEAAVQGFKKSLIESLYGIEQAYWDLVFAIENRKVKLQALEVAQKLLDENRKKYDRGVLSKLDVTQAESGAAQQQEGILTAENALLDASDRLKRLVDPALLKEESVIVPVDVPKAYEKELDEKAAEESAIAEAMSHRSDYKQLLEQIKSQDVTLAKADHDLLPRLDLTGKASTLGIDDTAGAANDMMRSLNYYDVAAGFVFELPLGRSAARGAKNRAELERRRFELQKRNLEYQILVEVRAAVRQIKTNEKRIEATRKARLLTQEQFDAEKNRQEQGLSTTLRVLDVQKDLTAARTNEVKALLDYRLSLSNLQRVTGTLLEKNDVFFQDSLTLRVPVER